VTLRLLELKMIDKDGHLHLNSHFKEALQS
jgi:hypothetical protein